MPEERKCLAVIRVRGMSDISNDVKETLQMLHLTRNCHATIIDNRPSYLGMLHKARSCLAWGEISKESIELLLEKRGRLVGNKRLTEEYVQRNSFKTLSDLAEIIHKVKVEYSSLPDIKPLFRLHPPKKGYQGKVKRSYSAGGVTGYQGEAINDLIKQMT